jgi:hypothetical protein
MDLAARRIHLEKSLRESAGDISRTYSAEIESIIGKIMGDLESAVRNHRRRIIVAVWYTAISNTRIPVASLERIWDVVFTRLRDSRYEITETENSAHYKRKLQFEGIESVESVRSILAPDRVYYIGI